MNQHNEITGNYENIEFNLTTGQTDYDLAINQATFLSVFGPTNVARDFPTWCEIRTNFTISVKVNSTSNHSITISSTDTPFVINGLKISDLFFTNSSGSTAAIKVRFQDSPY